jgi:hypothetical protein
MHTDGNARRSRAADSLEASGFHGRTCLPQSFLCIIMQKSTDRSKGQEGYRGDCGSVRYDRFFKYFGTAACRCVQREMQGQDFSRDLRQCFRQRDPQWLGIIFSGATYGRVMIGNSGFGRGRGRAGASGADASTAR